MSVRGVMAGLLIGAALILFGLLIRDARRPAVARLGTEGLAAGSVEDAGPRRIGQPVPPLSGVGTRGGPGAVTRAIPVPAPKEGKTHPDALAKGALPGERVLSFATDEELRRFAEWAKSRGLDVAGEISTLRALRIRAGAEGGGAKLDDVLKDSPVEARTEFNLRLRSPELPGDPLSPPDAPYAGFGPRALAWLGVSADNLGWGRGVTVAVLDTGVQPHLALLDERVTRLDLVNGAGAAGAESHAWHGTAVASLIAGNSPDLRGVAPGVNLLAIRVMNDDGVGDTFTLARGIVEAVERGARVINICLGSQGDSLLLEDAVKHAIRKGVAIVAAAGNDGVEGVFYPARYEGVVAVAGVDAAGRHVYFSNRGPQVDIAAPAIGVSAAWGQDEAAMFSGTSAAAPLVSGALAWLLAVQPGLTAGEAVRLLQQYSDDSMAPGADAEVGAGILNVRRLLEREQRGIRDMALAPFFVPVSDPGERFVSVWCVAQNRGTEPLRVVDLNFSVGGQSESAVFYNVAVGQTVSRERRVDMAALRNAAIAVSAEVSIRGESDTYPANNRRESVLTPRAN